MKFGSPHSKERGREDLIANLESNRPESGRPQFEVETKVGGGRGTQDCPRACETRMWAGPGEE